MCQRELRRMFNRADDEFLAYDNIKPERRFHTRPDINAFILLDKLVPGTRDMVCASEHDEIWLDVDFELLAKSAVTEEDVRDLVRCGVRYDEHSDSLAMFT